MKYIIVYDNTGRIYSQYSGDNDVPDGIPYLVLEDYNDSYDEENYRPILRVDVTKTPHEPVFGKTKHEIALESYSLEEYKLFKINKSKELLEEYLELYPLISTAHNGNEGTYNVTAEKQSLMMSQYMTYQIEKNINPNAVLTWNETGEECEVWTEEEFLQLVLEMKQYVYPMVSYQQSLEKSIKNVTTIEELDAIIIDYGQFNNKDIVEEE